MPILSTLSSVQLKLIHESYCVAANLIFQSIQKRNLYMISKLLRKLLFSGLPLVHIVKLALGRVFDILRSNRVHFIRVFNNILMFTTTC